MTNKTYIFNKETQKIELHFSKQEYQALPENLKSALKSAFLFSGKSQAWVSRSTNNHYWAIETAKKLGFTEQETVGERLTYEEELNRKAEKAEARAERYEEYSDNAEKRAEQLQAALKSYHGDISFFTQPIIAGHAGSQAFARYREKLYNRYRKGFEEYEKSEYYKDRAATARATANNVKLNDKVYLHNKIKECNKQLKTYQEIIIKYEEALYKIQQGEIMRNRSGEVLTEEYIEQRIKDILEKYDYEEGKREFFDKCMDELGGVQFSKENIKVGYIVNMKRWGKCEIVSAGSVNVGFKILTGGAAGGILTEPYEAITEILEVKEAETIENPYQVGDILVTYSASGKWIVNALQVLKVTEKSVTIQKIKLDENRKPVRDAFIEDSKPERKGIVKSKYRDYVGAYYNDWQLYKYIDKDAATA
jgi:hypothetical protein